MLARAGLLAVLLAISGTAAADEPGWPYYGGDEGGQRYSAAAQITPANVGRLTAAWTFSTGDLASKGTAMHRASFEVTPILDGGRLYLCSPFDEVSALDPGTGRQIWGFDPRIDPGLHYPNSFICRGVAFWRSPKSKGGLCASRIFLATNVRRLIALDAASGMPFTGFGEHGTVSIYPQPAMIYPSEVQITSAPVVTHGLVIVGSSIDDNQRVNAPRGTVHAYDAETGALGWSFGPVPRAAGAP